MEEVWAKGCQEQSIPQVHVVANNILIMMNDEYIIMMGTCMYRSYYKCTEEGCRVKKQVQRLSGDEGVVVTTYQGVHTHPVDKLCDNFHHILTQMHIFPPL